MKKTTFVRKPKKSVRIAENDAETEQDKTNEKKPVEAQQIGSKALAGSRVSVITGKPVISTGHSFVDSAFGGGFPIGHSALIQEDTNSTYYKTLLSLFIAQGLCLPETQRCLVISPFPQSFLPLPKAISHAESSTQKAPQDKLIIAWRYDNIQEKSNPSGTRRPPFNNAFDLHKQMELGERAESLELLSLLDLQKNFPPTLVNNQHSSLDFLNNILNIIQTRITQASKDNVVLRIVLHSFGSPFWFSQKTYQIEKEIIRFLQRLKGLLRNSTSVCMISLPPNLHSDSLVSKMQRISDIVCAFDSFQGETDTDIDPAFKDYQGFFNVPKLPKVNSLTRHLPDTISYVFARKRHKLLIEVFSLPPELTRATENSSSQSAAKMLCSPGPQQSSVLDF